MGLKSFLDFYLCIQVILRAVISFLFFLKVDGMCLSVSKGSICIIASGPSNFWNLEFSTNNYLLQGKGKPRQTVVILKKKSTKYTLILGFTATMIPSSTYTSAISWWWAFTTVPPLINSLDETEDGIPHMDSPYPIPASQNWMIEIYKKKKIRELILRKV